MKLSELSQMKQKDEIVTAETEHVKTNLELALTVSLNFLLFLSSATFIYSSFISINNLTRFLFVKQCFTL